MAQRSSRRGNWGLRGLAVVGTLAALTGFWQLAAHNPHPAPTGQAVTPVPTDTYSVPTNNGGGLSLPGPPNSGTGLSH
jgi:hypothetical protein